MVRNEQIDHGRAFDWGRTSPDYARYRDIYPPAFYQRILDMGACKAGQTVLDLGTGTGVLPRNLYRYGAGFTGVDSSEKQIEQARKLAQSQNMKIDFLCKPAEEITFPAASFDVVTACQCFTYFDHKTLGPILHRVLKPDGRFVVLYMAWLPFEDAIAGKSEALVLKYNPLWTGCGEKRHTISVPEVYQRYFEVEGQEIFDLMVPFSRESWNGRMKSCRGIGASLPEERVQAFDAVHRALLEQIAPQEFEVLHYAAICTLRKKG